jgi:cell division protein FtsB
VDRESEASGLPQRRVLLWIGPLAALAGAAFALLYDADNGLRAVFRVNAELARAELRLAKLSAERAELVDRAERLRSDPFEIESVARESFGMVRPGEIVVRLRGSSPRGD